MSDSIYFLAPHYGRSVMAGANLYSRVGIICTLRLWAEVTEAGAGIASKRLVAGSSIDTTAGGGYGPVHLFRLLESMMPSVVSRFSISEIEFPRHETPATTTTCFPSRAKPHLV